MTECIVMYLYMTVSCNYKKCFPATLTSLKREVCRAFQVFIGATRQHSSVFGHVPELAPLLPPVSLTQCATMRRNTALMFFYSHRFCLRTHCFWPHASRQKAPPHRQPASNTMATGSRAKCGGMKKKKSYFIIWLLRG